MTDKEKSNTLTDETLPPDVEALVRERQKNEPNKKEPPV